MKAFEVLQEIDEYAEIDYKDNLSIGELYTSNYDAKNKGFAIINATGKYETEYSIKQQNKIKEFALVLKECGNIRFAMKESGLGYHLASYYCKILNDECGKRGLPLIFKGKVRSNLHSAKLKEKQVSYIKYLITKYSCYAVAKMYNVSQSAINLIGRGLTWKNVEPVIKNENQIKIVNQFLRKIEPVKEMPNKVEIGIEHWELLRRVHANRWGLGNVVCPFCKHDYAYVTGKRIGWKCANRKCQMKFNVLTGTIYEQTKIGLDKWFWIEKNHLLKSQAELALEIGLTQKTVWKIQEKVKRNPFKSLLLEDFKAPINY